MKVKKKEYNIIVDLLLLYETALEDIAFLVVPEGDPNESNEWLARKRKQIAVDVLKKGYDLEFGNNTK